MKLGFLIFGALLTNFFVSHAMEELVIKMPKASVLTHRLCVKGMDKFMEQTGIVTQLADREKTVSDIVTTIEGAVDSYVQYLEQRRGSVSVVRLRKELMLKNKSRVFEAVLADHPQILDEFKKRVS